MATWFLGCLLLRRLLSMCCGCWGLQNRKAIPWSLRGKNPFLGALGQSRVLFPPEANGSCDGWALPQLYPVQIAAGRTLQDSEEGVLCRLLGGP